MTTTARLALLLLVLLVAPALHAQGRPREIECSFLPLTGCKKYVIEVFRVEPDGSELRQPDTDTYLVVDPDTLDAAEYLVLDLYTGDGLDGQRSTIWVDRARGAVGGDWASTLRNDAVRSANLRGVPGDLVELFNASGKRPERGMARMVLFSGQNTCKTTVNLDERNAGGCTLRIGGGVAGKVSLISIRYRASGFLGRDSLPDAEEPPAGAKQNQQRPAGDKPRGAKPAAPATPETPAPPAPPAPDAAPPAAPETPAPPAPPAPDAAPPAAPETPAPPAPPTPDAAPPPAPEAGAPGALPAPAPAAPPDS